eukprot:g5994.t1
MPLSEFTKKLVLAASCFLGAVRAEMLPPPTNETAESSAIFDADAEYWSPEADEDSFLDVQLMTRNAEAPSHPVNYCGTPKPLHLQVKNADFCYSAWVARELIATCRQKDMYKDKDYEDVTLMRSTYGARSWKDYCQRMMELALLPCALDEGEQKCKGPAGINDGLFGIDSNNLPARVCTAPDLSKKIQRKSFRRYCSSAIFSDFFVAIL